MVSHRRTRRDRPSPRHRPGERAGAPAGPLSDHFSAVAAGYAEFRPRYPADLFAWLASLTPHRRLAWDCAAGSGQATLDLVHHYQRVIATDLSAAQLARAPAHPQVEYRVAPAESSGLDDGSADLIVVAQALHWFDRDRFYAEVRRVGAEAGVLAAWTYRLCSVGDAAIDGALGRFYSDVLGPWWPPERQLVDTDYRTIDFPFTELRAPRFEMTAEWTLGRLLGYLRTWSATSRYLEARGHDPVAPLAQELAAAWGNSGSRRVVWSLGVRAGRI